VGVLPGGGVWPGKIGRGPVTAARASARLRPWWDAAGKKLEGDFGGTGAQVRARLGCAPGWPPAAGDAAPLPCA